MNPRKNVTIQNNKININIMKEFLRIAYYEHCRFVLELVYKFGTMNTLAFYIGELSLD